MFTDYIQRRKRVAFTILTVILTVFIFAQSILPAETSSKESGWVLNFLNSITEFFGLGSIFTSHVVRKLAHFTEFAFLGVFFRLSINTYKPMAFKQYIITLMGCLSIAVCDECIQLFSPGRAGRLSDVMIDFSGSLFGVTLITLFIVFTVKQRTNKNRGKI